MDPDFQSNQPGPGQSLQPQQTPQVNPPSTPPNSSTGNQQQLPDQNSYGGDYSSGSGGDNRTKKLLIIIAALVGLFVIIAIVALAFSGGEGGPTQQLQEEVEGEFYVKEPTAVDVESVNNSISDNISGLNTDADFPEDNLSDLNLGL